MSQTTFTVATTVAELATQWAAAQTAGGLVRWQFSQSLYQFSKTNPTMALAQIGAALASAVGRTEPFSKGWVSRGISAAKAFPVQPNTPALAQAFLDKWDGKSAKGKSGKGMSTETQVKMALGMLTKALADGHDADDILTRVTELCAESAAPAKKGKHAA